MFMEKKEFYRDLHDFLIKTSVHAQVGYNDFDTFRKKKSP